MQPRSTINFETLPVELIAEILGALDLRSLIIVSCLSRRLRQITSDAALNPWKEPILRNLHSAGAVYEDSFRNLSALSTIPRNNWIEIFSIARAEYILWEASHPVLSESEWEECFRKRFLPDWIRWKKDGRWKQVFLKMLYKVVHRMNIPCTGEEAWTKFVVLNRNGTANLLTSTSRNFNPMVLFNEMKIQNNLAHLETCIRVVVEFADVRILALGVLNHPRSTFSINDNARALLHPPGISKDEETEDAESILTDTHDNPQSSSFYNRESDGFKSPQSERHYCELIYPMPTPAFARYPFYTPGGGDRRWFGSGAFEEQGRHWVGGLLLTVQLVSQQTREQAVQQDHDVVNGPGRSAYASFSWPDLDAIAPWMADRITKRIDGQGLGN